MAAMDEAFRLMRQALIAQNQAGYAQARYVYSVHQDEGLEAKAQAARTEADTATVAAWQALYAALDKV